MNFTNSEGIVIVNEIIKQIQKNKNYLSEIDGAIGDGDHGINMNKGFSMAADELLSLNANMSEGFMIISKKLMDKIGGSMGPLYGSLFRGLSIASRDEEKIDGAIIKKMLRKSYDNILTVSSAKVNDKTLVDVLDPSINIYEKVYDETNDVVKALESMIKAADEGLEATKHMVAKLGRASRLGERSLNHQDAGATSCNIILVTFAKEVMALLK